MVQESSNILIELEKAIEHKKIKFGTNQTLQAIKLGLAAKVVFANNIPKTLKDDLLYYCKLAETPLVEFAGNAMELGVKCKRAHTVMGLCILK
jgi:ribosomal protein L30E